jgi:predicted nucleic acid-binding protein
VALTARYLVDTSAAARMTYPQVKQLVGPIIDSGAVATIAVLDYEAFYSARSPAEFARVRHRRKVAYEYLPTDDEHWQRALDAQLRLAQSGRHRAVGIADLLTGALAEAHRLTVLHYDSDFDAAASVLDFEHRWVAEPGTL